LESDEARSAKAEACPPSFAQSSLGKRRQFGTGRTIREVPRARVAASIDRRHDMIERLRVDPISSYLERRRKGPIFPVIVADGLVYLSGLPPFDPETGDIKPLPFERQAEIVLDQMKLCLETAGSSLAQVLKCNVYCTPDPSHFAAFNEVYARYFASESPARIFLHVPSWPGPFDVEIDCVAVV
jgi:2-iminobutanoate/2-iminopropanoate deaminase